MGRLARGGGGRKARGLGPLLVPVCLDDSTELAEEGGTTKGSEELERLSLFLRGREFRGASRAGSDLLGIVTEEEKGWLGRRRCCEREEMLL